MSDPLLARHCNSVAIVGIGCRFPGGICDTSSFWRLLSEGRTAITEIPRDRIDLGRLYAPTPATPGRMMTRWGGYLERIDEFDAGFFGISPREAERMDPQQRLLLETAWEALEDAGQDLHGVDNRKAGVFVGQWTSDFESRLFADPERVDFFMTTGSGRYAASGRLSYLLGFRGPSLTIDTACSSSLAAIHLAVRSIRSGESAMALAGGVNVILQPHISIAYSQSRMMAPDGRCKFGDASGDGYVRSEGVGLVVLKSLDSALAANDRIYAVIRGSAINNDGRTGGSMGTPSRIGQEELLRAAYADAGLSPGRVGYIEAHGTGTRAGDPVELGALGSVIAGEVRTRGCRTFVGSVKTNIGHTEGAAGAAGLIKAALALHHRSIPPSLNFREPSPAIPWSDIPCEIVRELTPWPADEYPHVAGVSAFGIAGTNGHVVLEEAAASAPPTCAATPGRATNLLPLSARSPKALQVLASRYADLLSATDAPALCDVCWSAATRRTSLEHRVAFVASDRAAVVDALRRFAAGDGAAAVAEGLVELGSRPRVAFIVPGQGAQWIGMGRELVASEPVFRATLERCQQAAQHLVDWSILEQLAAEPDSDGFRLHQIDVIQPVLLSIAIAYAELLKSLGVEPDAVVGHSMGEVGAAYIAGVLDLGQAMEVIIRRSALLRRVSGQGAMALVELPMQDLHERLAGLEHVVSVAASNSPRSSVISGQPEAVQRLLTSLETDGVFCRLVKVDVASHSPQMEPLAVELAAELAGLTPGDDRIPICSTVLGRRAAGQVFGAQYWAMNMRQPVLFTTAIEALTADGVGIFVELSPHPVLLSSVQQTAPAAKTLASGRKDEPEQAALLTTVAGLWAAGCPIDWRRVMAAGGRTVQLPLYPWQRERHWVEDAEIQSPAASGIRVSRTRPDEETRGWVYHLRWEPSDQPAPNGTATPTAVPWLVLSGDEAAGSAVAVALRTGGVTATSAPLNGLEATLLDHAGSPTPPRGIVILAQDDAAAAFLPVRVLQACLRADWSHMPRLWFATQGGQAVIKEAGERVSVDQGALWGAARVVGEEHPDLWGGLIDLDPAATASANATFLAGHVLRDNGGENETAVRSDRHYVQRLARDDRDVAHEPFTCREDAGYLVTGGLGDIGLLVARALADRGARRLLLLGRTPLPPRDTWAAVDPASVAGRRIAAVRTLEARGVAVHITSVDVADEAALRTFLDQYELEGWPAIRGVVHAAGLLNNGLAGSMDPARFDTVMHAKLRGARLLDRLLPNLDLFVLLSSISAFLPHPGVANYAASNAGLDALAQDRRARGLPGLSIQWGPWQNTGLALGEAAEHAVAEMARHGVQAIPPERGAMLFSWLCGRPVATAAVMPTDWTGFRRARAGRLGSLFRDIAADVPEATKGQSALLSEFEQAGPAERRQALERVVKHVVGRVLKIAPARLDPHKTFGNMGLGSLMAIELRNHLETALGRPLSATLALNYPTIDALVSHLAVDEPSPAPDDPVVVSSDTGENLMASLNRVVALSDESAMLALLTQPAG